MLSGQFRHNYEHNIYNNLVDSAFSADNLIKMVLPHTGTFGRMYTSSRALHHLIAILGVGLYLLDMPTFGVAACFGTFLARMPGAKVAARSSTIAAATTSL